MTTQFFFFFNPRIAPTDLVETESQQCVMTVLILAVIQCTLEMKMKMKIHTFLPVVKSHM